MRTKFYLTALLLSALAFASCEKEDFHYEDAFDASYRTWLDFKETSNNSYHYMVTGSTWTGSSWWTIITVENGTVTRRQFMYDVFHDIVAPPSGWAEAQIQE